MRLSQITVNEVAGSLRFDSKFHISRQNPVLRVLKSGKWKLQQIGTIFGTDNIWSGNIFARVYASSPEHGKPLLVPYDLFRYVPWSDKILSETQVKQFKRLKIKRGCLFIVCSGRNLGPVTIADKFCEQFTMSHDMVRIAVEPNEELFYLAAFLSTSQGQALIRTDMNGSVIDHTDEDQIAAIEYPIVSPRLKKFCAEKFKSGFEKREHARTLLAQTQTQFLELFGLNEPRFSSAQRSRRFQINRSQIQGRLDAEPFAPQYRAWKSLILKSGGCPLGSIANVFKPSGRARTVYIQDRTLGVPMMNGRQISQYRAIGLQHMSLASVPNLGAFIINAGTTLLTADGRAEENLADCAFVTEDRDGWAASGHVHRVTPNESVHPGLVYLACSCAPVQSCIKALATGSVVDGLSDADVSSVMVPYSDKAAARKLGNQAVEAWQSFKQSSLDEGAAIAALEEEFSI